MYQRTRKRKNGTTWTAFYYRDATGKDVPLGKDLDKARLKWAELEAKDKPDDLTMMKGIFDRYERDAIPKKGERTQKDNLAELKQLRPMFDGAPIDSITPANIAGTAMRAPQRFGPTGKSPYSPTYSIWRGSGALPSGRIRARASERTRRLREIITPTRWCGMRSTGWQSQNSRRLWTWPT
jgi:hypothetical protein